MNNIIDFPSPAERRLRQAVSKAATALRNFLADGPKPASCCRRISDKTGGDRKVYDLACASLNLWCIVIGGVYLALPAHGRNAGLDHYGQPAARPLKPKQKA